MKVKYRDIRFHAKTRTVIDLANVILDEYLEQGFTMTLRQLFYQFVSRDLIANILAKYKKLGTIIRDGRIAGLIDWDSIEDRTRSLRTHSLWGTPEDIIRSAARSYAEDRWGGQLYRPDFWVEKAALLGVIEPICNEYRVPYFATIGNCSLTEMRDAGERFADYIADGEMRDAGERFADYIADGLTPLVLHLADHDPNGIDMTRDIRERLAMFAGADIEVRRIALNMDQVRRYNPPPNFAKEEDKRFKKYAAEFGRQCWELDALAPSVLAGLIRDELDQMIDAPLWRQGEKDEQRNRKLLTTVSENWALVKKAVAA